MPVSSRRCGMITRREAERLCKSFLSDQRPPQLPEDFSFKVEHGCGWGCKGQFLPSRYTSSRAKCVQCDHCHLFFSPNKFIFHSHRRLNGNYVQPDAANFNAWRRHLTLVEPTDDDLLHAWEDVKAMFNGGSRRRLASPSPITVNRKSVKQDTTQNSSHPRPTALSIESTTTNNSITSSRPLSEHQSLLNSFTVSPPSFWPYPSPILPSSLLLSQPSLFAPALYNFKPTYDPNTFLTNNTPQISAEVMNERNKKAYKETETNVSKSSKEEPEGEKELSKYTSLSKEQLQELLINEIEARKKLEQDLQILKEAFLKQLNEKQQPLTKTDDNH